MSLCFVANKDLTVPYSDIARRLKKRGEQIVWLSPSTRWSKWLIAEGWPAADILNLPDRADEWRDLSVEQSADSLADLEREAPATISNIILMCRNLRHLPARFSYAYLAVARRHIEPFLRQRNVEVAFGEGTWGFELLTWLICQRYDIPMVTMAPTRIPNGRFYFADAMSSGLFSFAQASSADREWAEQFLTTWLNRPAPPDYMLQHSLGYQPFHARWLKELAIGLFRPGLDRHDATLWPLRSRIADRVGRYVKALSSKYLRPYQTVPSGERYVLYPLHHQPESAVDVYGSLNSDQVALIHSLSRLIPSTHKLWVKEHRGAIGDRSIAWYRDILALPNVRLIDPFQDIYGLIRGADLVVTISGTTGYESALLGVPTLGLAPVFFSSLLLNRPTARSHPNELPIHDILTTGKTKPDQAGMRSQGIDFLAHLYANSFVGSPYEAAVGASRRAAPDYLASESDDILRFASAVRQQRPAISSSLGSS